MSFQLMDKVILQSTSRSLSPLCGKQGRVVRINYNTNSYRVELDCGGIVDCRVSELGKLEVQNEEVMAIRLYEQSVE